MIIYFSGTGNSHAIARRIAERLNESLMLLPEAVDKDLTQEKRIGLVFPSYDFNIPPAVRTLVPRLKISKETYVFVVIPCGAQAGNCIWSLKRMLAEQGIELAYGHKIRVPDNSAIAFGRNPNDQTWKFERFAGRLEQIISDLQAERHALHFAWWSPLAWIMARPAIEAWMLRTFRPQVNEAKCIGCGTCAKVCPMRNIVLTERSGNQPLAAVGPHCTACLACVHFCPQQAVQVNGQPTLRERQYHHPQIKLKDVLKSL